jgi:hypothetical protein
VAVPLRPGDYLIFNALIPHCISSCCKLDDEIMCVSVYLKTSIVGMNNNDLALTPTQSIIVNKLQSYKLKQFIDLLKIVFIKFCHNPITKIPTPIAFWLYNNE